ncbi:MAG TPA: glutathione S-transferase [Alphaproteobacteria bacterium]|nr:glutathione S-transferase [Alphaproteobacteria bacterium]
MKLYDYRPAPSPRRLRIFMAEKRIEIPTVQIDLRRGEQFSESFRAVNPQCTVPVLELDDGTVISEITAICRYLEETHPTPPLLGRDAKERALVAMWDHRMELEGFYAVAEAFRNSTPGFKGHALTGPQGYEQIPALVERGKARVKQFFQVLDQRLAECEYVAGARFSVADITAMTSVDFAGWVKLGIPDDHTNLKRWHAAVSARPSAKA